MADVSFAAAVLAGLLSFLSPCILPMVPFYLSYMAGAGMDRIVAGARIDPGIRRRAMLSASFFAAGVITIFVALGLSASLIGQVVREWFDVLRWIAAALILVMGLHFLGVVRIGLLYRQLRADAGNVSKMSLAGAYVVGLAFAFGWTPCVGPVLAAILFTAAGAESAGRGAGLLLTYGLGMTLPFILAAAFIGPFMSWMARFRRWLPWVERTMGALLVVFAVLIATNSMNVIAQWMIETMPVFLKIG